MQRRSFLAGILAAASAPAIVRADYIMRINPAQGLVLPTGLTCAMARLIWEDEGPHFSITRYPEAMRARGQIMRVTSIRVEGQGTFQW